MITKDFYPPLFIYAFLDIFLLSTYGECGFTFGALFYIFILRKIRITWRRDRNDSMYKTIRKKYRQETMGD